MSPDNMIDSRHSMGTFMLNNFSNESFIMRNKG